MRVLVSGGGSGGHITPALAVIDELAKLDQSIDIYYVIDRGSKFRPNIDRNKHVKKCYQIFAGKFRRYYSVSMISQLLDIKTMWLNARDLIKLVIGLFQSAYLLLKLKPDVIFVKGGYVCLPLGLIGALYKIPIVTHDSDVLAGLANRIVGKYAKKQLVGMPTEYYNYPTEKIIFVGSPVHGSFLEAKNKKLSDVKSALNISNIQQPILLITGGGLGAVRLNSSVANIFMKLKNKYPNILIFHTVGHGNLKKVEQQYYSEDKEYENNVRLVELTNDMALWMAVADVVISRAGATTLGELAVMQKPTILVPNPYLTGGHQLHNAKKLVDAESVLVVDESELQNESTKLYDKVVELLENSQLSKDIAHNLHQLAVPDSAVRIAKILIKVGSSK